MTDPRVDNPDPQQLADDDDQLGWDRDKHGLMADAATDDEPETVPYEPDGD